MNNGLFDVQRHKWEKKKKKTKCTLVGVTPTSVMHFLKIMLKSGKTDQI